MAVKRTVQLYASITASGDALAAITVPRRSRLIGVAWSISLASGSAGDSLQLELSVNSARQVTTNDATGVISIHGDSIGLTTSGATQNTMPYFHPCDMQFEDGDKIYLHATEAGGSTHAVRVLLYFS